MTEHITDHNPNVTLDENQIQLGIEVADLINQQRDRTWGEYIADTVSQFETTQEMFDPAIDEQMSRLLLLLPDIQIAEGLQSPELPELKRASIIAIQRALLVRRQAMDID